MNMITFTQAIEAMTTAIDFGCGIGNYLTTLRQQLPAHVKLVSGASSRPMSSCSLQRTSSHSNRTIQHHSSSHIAGWIVAAVAVGDDNASTVYFARVGMMLPAAMSSCCRELPNRDATWLFSKSVRQLSVLIGALDVGMPMPW